MTNRRTIASLAVIAVLSARTTVSLLAVITVLHSTAVAGIPGNTHHNRALHFSITPPSGWEPIPKLVLLKLNTRATEVTGQTIRYADGFSSPTDSTDYIQPPYILIQQLTQDIPPSERFSDLVESMTSGRYEQIERETAEQLADHIEVLDSSIPLVDRHRYRILIEQSSLAYQDRELRCLSAMNVGRRQVISILCYSFADEFDVWRPRFREVVDSFRFDAGYERRESTTSTATSAREFLEGHIDTFSTRNHPKSKGVHFTISYPTSWAAAEGIRPNIVQKFVSEGGHGLESILIVTKALPRGVILTEQDQMDLFSPSGLRDMLPPRATFVDAKATAIEATPAGILEYQMRGERAGMTVLLHVQMLVFVSDNILVQVQFYVGGPAGSEGDIARRMTAFKPLFSLIANSIVFPDKWTAATQPPAQRSARSRSGSALPFDDPSLLFQTLAVSFIITWVFGLTPPLVIRFVIARHPLSKSTASWIAAGFSAFFWMAFFALNTALGEKPGIGFVWVIMFFIARWIMSRGHVSASGQSHATSTVTAKSASK